jgi:hypothetical protein
MDRNQYGKNIRAKTKKWVARDRQNSGHTVNAKTTSTSMTTNATNKGGSSNMSAFYEKIFFINVI